MDNASTKGQDKTRGPSLIGETQARLHKFQDLLQSKNYLRFTACPCKVCKGTIVEVGRAMRVARCEVDENSSSESESEDEDEDEDDEGSDSDDSYEKWTKIDGLPKTKRKREKGNERKIENTGKEGGEKMKGKGTGSAENKNELKKKKKTARRGNQ